MQHNLCTSPDSRYLLYLPVYHTNKGTQTSENKTDAIQWAYETDFVSTWNYLKLVFSLHGTMQTATYFAMYFHSYDIIKKEKNGKLVVAKYMRWSFDVFLVLVTTWLLQLSSFCIICSVSFLFYPLYTIFRLKAPYTAQGPNRPIGPTRAPSPSALMSDDIKNGFFLNIESKIYSNDYNYFRPILFMPPPPDTKSNELNNPRIRYKRSKIQIFRGTEHSVYIRRRSPKIRT